MGLTKISTPANGFLHQANKILGKKCRVFIAKGKFDTADIPDTKAELAALYSGATAKFIPLGDNDESGSKIGWKQKTKKIDFSTIPLGYEITGVLVNVTITSEMLTFADTLGTEEYSLLFVPDSDDSTFFALSGITINTEGELPVMDGDNIGKVTFNLSKDADKIATVVKYAVLAS